MSKFALTKHAKLAPGVIHMPGLFVIACPSQKSMKPRLTVSQKIGEMKYQFNGPEQLTVADLEVLLGLIALAGVQTDSYKSHRQLTGSSPDTRLRQMLTKQVVVRTTCSELARELDRAAGGGNMAPAQAVD